MSGTKTVACALCVTFILLLLSVVAASPATITMDDSGESVVDVWDCTYLARAIAGVRGYSV